MKFSGDRTAFSVTAFFERVKEMRKARNVNKEILLESEIDLFEGRIYEFYLYCRIEVFTSDTLLSKFKNISYTL